MALSMLKWLQPVKLNMKTKPILVAAIFSLIVFINPGSHAQSFQLTSALKQWRFFHSATLLTNGSVLVAGGRSSLNTVTNSVEILNPITGIWSYTTPMSIPRSRHTAVLLTNGCVLVIGGESSGFRGTNTCEIFDPGTMTWANTGSMNYTRYIPTATLLQDGRVLVAGGGITNCEIYDPATRVWTDTGSTFVVRTNHSAVLLPDGKVLVAGGSSDTNTEIYNPKSGLWKKTGAMQRSRKLLSMSLLPDGKVLVVGGYNSGTTNTTAEIYNPSNGVWSYTGSMKTTSVGGDNSGSIALLNLLPNGTVFAMVPYTFSEIFDPNTGEWIFGPGMITNRWGTDARSVLLRNGRLLFVGGYNIPTNEIYNSTNAPTRSFGQIYLERQPDNSVVVSFTCTPNGTNAIIFSTNAALPKASWSKLGTAKEFAPGIYLFNDSTNTGFSQGYYRLRSP